MGQLNVRLSESEHASLRAAAGRAGVSASELLRSWITDGAPGDSGDVQPMSDAAREARNARLVGERNEDTLNQVVELLAEVVRRLPVRGTDLIDGIPLPPEPGFVSALWQQGREHFEAALRADDPDFGAGPAPSEDPA